MNAPVESPVSVFAQRRARVARRMQERGCTVPAVLAAGWARPRNFAHSHFPFRAESHFLYLVGRHIEGAILVLFPEGRAVLYAVPPSEHQALWSGPAPSLEDWSARLDLSVLPVEELDLDRAAVLPPQDEATAAWLGELLDQQVDAQGGPALEGQDAALAQALIDERLVKDDAAIEQLSWIARLSAEAHVLGMKAGVSAIREAEVRAQMEAHFIRAGLGVAYTSIVTSQGQILHAERSDGLVRVGDLMLCDVGGESKEGFAADITRTWPVGGRFSPTQRDLYQAVLDVQTRAIASAQPGVHYADLHRAAVADLGQALLDLGILRHRLDDCVSSGAVSVFFPHGLGHLLGLDVHDMEDLGDRAGYDEHSQRSKDPVLRFLRLSRRLESNMVVTIEPGFYQVPLLLEEARRDAAVASFINWERLRQFGDVRGIRIEDDVLVAEEGPRVLSAGAPKRVEDIEAVMTGA